MTGKNPAKHGIFHFRTFDLTKYTSFSDDLATSRNFANDTIFKLASDAGLRVAALAVPMTYPPFPVNGVMLSGYPTPNLQTAYTYPPDMSSRFTNINITSEAFRHSDPERIRSATHMVKQLTDYCVELMQEDRYDLLMVVYTNTDMANHFFRKYVDQGYPTYDPEGAKTYGNVILEQYQMADEAVGRLLEIGCGPGVFMKVGSDRGWEVCGVEIAQHFIAYAREELGLDVRRARDLREAGFDEGEFDVVYSSHVLEHLLDPCGALVDARRALKPGGLLVAVVPNQFDDIMFPLFRPWKRHVALRDQLALNHTYFFTRPVLRTMIETCGFEVSRQTTYSRRLQRRLDSRIVGGRYLRELISMVGGLVNKGPVIEVFARKPEGTCQHYGVIPQDQCAK